MTAHYDNGSLIRIAINWAESDAPENFDATFFYSLKDAYEHYGQLTHNQERALMRILEKFHVNAEEYDYEND